MRTFDVPNFFFINEIFIFQKNFKKKKLSKKEECFYFIYITKQWNQQNEMKTTQFISTNGIKQQNNFILFFDN